MRDLSFERAVRFAAGARPHPLSPGDEGAVARRIVDELRGLQFEEVCTAGAETVVARVRSRGRHRREVVFPWWD